MSAPENDLIVAGDDDDNDDVTDQSEDDLPIDTRTASELVLPPATPDTLKEMADAFRLFNQSNLAAMAATTTYTGEHRINSPAYVWSILDINLSFDRFKDIARLVKAKAKVPVKSSHLDIAAVFMDVDEHSDWPDEAAFTRWIQAADDGEIADWIVSKMKQQYADFLAEDVA